MKLVATPLAGAFVVESEALSDERGTFMRTFCARDFARAGLVAAVAQTSISITNTRGTLRGMHFQVAPHQEAKLVRCLRGAIHDVIVNLATREHFAIELADPTRALYVPPDFAHGFLTLTDDVHVLYQMSAEYEPRAARGLRWNDPALAIAWPFEPTVINARDASYPLLEAS